MKDNILPILKGISLPRFEARFKKLGDFLYYEGPILSHLINDKNDDYLMKWCDKDSSFHRWVIFKTSSQLLYRFFCKELSMRDLILQNPNHFVYFVDINEKIEWEKTFIIGLNDIPVHYLPSATAFFEEEQYEQYVLMLKNYLEYHFTRLEKLAELPKEPFFTTQL